MGETLGNPESSTLFDHVHILKTNNHYQISGSTTLSPGAKEAFTTQKWGSTHVAVYPLASQVHAIIDPVSLDTSMRKHLKSYDFVESP